MIRRLTQLLALGIALAAAPATALEPFAARLDASNVDRLAPRGPHAITGIDDWALGNGVLCAGISDLGRVGRFGPAGGQLVDLSHCGRADDQFAELHPMTNLSRQSSPPFDSIRAERTRNAEGVEEARIVIRAEEAGLRTERSYILDTEEPRRMRVVTRVERVAPGGELSTWGELAMHPSGSMRPFGVTVGVPERSSGYIHPGSDGESVAARIRGIADADLHVMVGDDSLEHPISYGIHAIVRRLEGPDGARTDELPVFGIEDDDLGMLTTFVRPPWLGGESVGLLQLAQAMLFLELEVGETFHLETHIYVSERSDAASITDFAYREAQRVEGRVDDATARIHVWTPSGDPFTQVRPEDSGRFGFRAPPGTYRLEVRSAGRAPLWRDLEVPEASEGALSLPAITVRPPTRLQLPQGAGPMRLVFVGRGGAEDPRLFDDLLGVRVGVREPSNAMVANSVSLAGTQDDPKSVVLAPGRYRVYATRGPEFTVSTTDFEIAAGTSQRLSIAAPVRAIETPGWIGADLHVHSIASFDSALSARERVRSFAAQGGEVLVSTEHDRIADLGGTIRSMGLGSMLASVTGVEATSVLHSEAAPHTFGHANVFPLEVRPTRFRDGAPTSQGVRLRGMIAEVRRGGARPIVQVNHPRSREAGANAVWDGSFFTHLSVAGAPYEPARPLRATPNRALIERDPETGLRDLDFDAIELMNGASEASLSYYRRIRADWFSLLLQGERRTATAASDSHLLSTPVAVPRTYVRMNADDPASFDEASFIRALREGRAFGSTAPFIEVRLGEAELGDRIATRSATLRVAVRAAEWARPSVARAWIDGTLAGEAPLDTWSDGRAEAAFELRFEQDAFVTVEVEGAPNETFSALQPGAAPFAFTNPIFVDADGDGAWTPAGLPERLPHSLTSPGEAP